MASQSHQPASPSREIFARQALELIPKILTLQDRNRLSETYGCFDRNHWHYRTIDFPSGILQEMSWVLALAHELDIPGNPYFQKPSIREWAVAAIRFAAKSSHPDGSCDDFFPYEKAGGAAAFSLLACAESYRLLGLDDADLLAFLAKRADWLANHHESGRLANHQALIVLCLDVMGEITGGDRWESARDKRLELLLGWQDPEGWFQEYEGCDPGYHTFTISLLASIHEKKPSPELDQALRRAISLASEFVHPDGSFGGEYGSRNTYNFFPHGFELFGRHMPEALSINDRVLEGIKNNLFPSFTDDHAIGHYPWNALLAWKDHVPLRPPPPPRKTGKLSLPNAGMEIWRGENWDLYIATNKGGLLRFFRNNTCVLSDTGVTLRTRDSRIAVCHLADQYGITRTENSIAVSGRMKWAMQKRMTPVRMILLRGFMLTLGRHFPDLVRKILQKILITGKKPTPFEFDRLIEITDEGCLSVTDRIKAPSWDRVENAAIGVDQTSIYVIMSRVFQVAQLTPWIDLTPRIRALGSGSDLLVTRRFDP